ncbi:MAG TPA: hypothetical protein VJP40_09280 [bacterium]|nr:hypothetical protein [bacterium]
MKIRLFLISAALLASATQASGLQARELSVGSSSDNEYVFLINLLTTFGNNLSTRDAVTELNDSPGLVTNQYSTFNSSSGDDSNGTSARLIRSDERLGVLGWIIKDNFNKDKWNVFDKQEYIDAGVPELGFLQGFAGALSQVVLQSEGDSRINLNVSDEDKDNNEFQF